MVVNHFYIASSKSMTSRCNLTFMVFLSKWICDNHQLQLYNIIQCHNSAASTYIGDVGGILPTATAIHLFGNCYFSKAIRH